MVRVLPELHSLSSLLLAQKLQLKEKFISPKVWVFFFNVVPGSVEFLHCCTCFSVTALSVLPKPSPCNGHLYFSRTENLQGTQKYFVLFSPPNKNGSDPAPLE